MPDIRHVVVLMLENRSFDCMLGRLYPASGRFDGLTGSEQNIWHREQGQDTETVWTDSSPEKAGYTIPDPDPGEAFEDMHQQIHGSAQHPAKMGGFVDNWMSLSKQDRQRQLNAVMHYFTPDALPVLSGLARSFGVSDRWFASAPCQTWPNRLFANTGCAGGDVNNRPEDVPYLMETVFERVAGGGKSWGIYFHDFPQAAVLGRLWPHIGGFHGFDEFHKHASAGTLPSYSFIEPRYYPDPDSGKAPNDQHPPHDVAMGEELIAAVYNALRSGPNWRNTLLIVTYDEHGGCYDHVFPGRAAATGEKAQNGYAFDTFGVRVPAVIVSPYVPAGSIIRPNGDTPFDHTSIFKTLQDLFGLDKKPLTPRTAAAPSLLSALSASPENDGPSQVKPRPERADNVQQLASAPPNPLQQSLAQAAVQLPTFGADVERHIKRLMDARQIPPVHGKTADALSAATAHLKAFLGI